MAQLTDRFAYLYFSILFHPCGRELHLASTRAFVEVLELAVRDRPPLDSAFGDLYISPEMLIVSSKLVPFHFSCGLCIVIISFQIVVAQKDGCGIQCDSGTRGRRCGVPGSDERIPRGRTETVRRGSATPGTLEKYMQQGLRESEMNQSV
jgi:hypothetical protein